MRKDPTGSQLTQLNREPRIVIGIIYDTGSIYVTNKADAIANVPGNVVHGVIEDISSVSRDIDPLEATSTIGGFSFAVTDVDGEVTDEIRAQLTAGNGIGQREVRVYTGDTDDFTDGTWSRVDTYVIDAVVAFDRGSYRFECSDRQRELRQKIFPKVTTRLAATITATSTTLTVTSVDGFDLVPHTASFSDAPSTSVCYVRVNKTKEIIRFTGFGSPASFTGCTRGVFGTIPQAITVNTAEDEEKWPELELVYYLEMPAPQLAYALATGVILDSGSPLATLPDGYHAGIDPAYVDPEAVQNIGTDLYDPSDPTGGLVLFFSTARGLKETNAKRFIEEQILFPMWAFWAISPDGVLQLRKLTRLLSDAAPSVIAYSENIIDHGALENRIDQLANRVIFNWNHDGQDYTRNTELLNLGSISAHGIGRTLEYDLLGFVVARHTRATLQRLFNSIIERYGAPPQELPLVLSSELNSIEAGDVARVILEGVRDYAGLAYLDRSFEILSKTWNPRTGELRVQGFGSTSVVAQDQPAGTSAALDDSWYTSEGTELSTVLTISGGAVTANGSVTGNADLRSGVYYFDGDLTINTGVTVSISDNVQLRIKGTLTVNGTIDGAGNGIASASDPNVVDAVYVTTQSKNVNTFGSTRPSGSLILGTAGIWSVFTPSQFTGIPSASPLNLSVASGALVGIPSELRGTEGNYGPPTLIVSSGFRVKALGGAGGNGGAGLMLVCRGLAFGASGEIDLSGSSGSSAVGSYVGGGRTVIAGAGSGGAPGVLAVILDGNDVLYPDLGDSFTATRAATPQTGNPIYTTAGSTVADPITGAGALAFLSAQDMWQSAHIVQWVPLEIETGESEDEEVPAPAGLTATADGAGVLLQWSPPPDDKYDVIEIWRATTNDRTGAVQVAQLKGSALTLTSDVRVTRYFWIRARSSTKGWSDWQPSSSTGGVVATYGGTGQTGVVSNAINSDPLFESDLTLPITAGGHWSAQADGSVAATGWSLVAVSDGTVGRFAAQITLDGTRDIFSREIPLDVLGDYQISVWARQPTGGRTSYLLVAFYDEDGNNISSGASDAAGWSIGTYHYWEVVAEVIPSTWTKYTFKFGPNSPATIPTGAVSCRIGGLLPYFGGAGTDNETTIQLQDYKLVRMIGTVELNVHAATETYVDNDTGPITVSKTSSGGSFSVTEFVLGPSVTIMAGDDVVVSASYNIECDGGTQDASFVTVYAGWYSASVGVNVHSGAVSHNTLDGEVRSGAVVDIISPPPGPSPGTYQFGLVALLNTVVGDASNLDVHFTNVTVQIVRVRR